MPQGEPMPYESPQPVDFRGDFKPEMVQMLMKLRNMKDEKGPASPISPEQLKQMLEKNVEITISDMAEADLTQSSELFLTNLIKELNQQEQERQQKQPVPIKEGQPVTGMSTADDEHELPVEPAYYFYDEWDFRAADYRPRWCRIVEYAVGEGAPQYFDQTLSKYASLVGQTRRQFELLRPEMFRKIKRLLDGEEIDFDAVTDYAVERRARVTPNDKIYWRRNKIERDVSVAFLLDMSASTDEEIAKHERKQQSDDFDDDPRRYFSWWMARRAQELLTPPKRIIDLEKESIVLLIKALETIGDKYGIYGFSGYGRDNVEFYVVKDLEEAFNDHVKKRIDKIAPVRSTRMGPAIRHATWKLDQQDSKVKILFLVSDGRPQDHGYGRDRTEKEYAIHDTKQALLEARRKGITPFALTVDKEGHDYLGQMCEDMGYEVVADIEQLPQRLPTLYRRLTE
jgi:nitric oxide reductase activation protein